MAQASKVGNMSIRAITLDVLRDLQQKNDFQEGEFIPDNPTIPEIVDTFDEILRHIREKDKDDGTNLMSTMEARNLQAIQRVFKNHKDNETLAEIFETIQDCSLSGKTLAETQKEVLKMYGGSNNQEDDEQAEDRINLTSQQLQELASGLWNLQKSWEQALQLRSSGKGKNNFYAVLAMVLGGVGLGGLVASSVWMNNLLTNPGTGTTANQVIDGRTVVPDNAAAQPTTNVPTQTDAGVSGNTGNSGSSAASNGANVTQPTGAETIAQGNATSATDIANAKTQASTNNNSAQAGAGTAITISIIVIAIAAFLLYMYYKKEREYEDDSKDEELAKGGKIFDKAVPASLNLDNLLHNTDSNISSNPSRPRNAAEQQGRQNNRHNIFEQGEEDAKSVVSRRSAS